MLNQKKEFKYHKMGEFDGISEDNMLIETACLILRNLQTESEWANYINLNCGTDLLQAIRSFGITRVDMSLQTNSRIPFFRKLNFIYFLILTRFMRLIIMYQSNLSFL